MTTPSDKKSSVFVVVPSHNHAPFIERCLQSVLKQTLRPSKMLVIDDGSTDNSPAIIEQVLKECTFPSELIVRPNRGLSATLNQGFALSEGDYFAYIGSDDVWLPEFLESRVSVLEKRPRAVLAYSYSYLIDAEDAIIDSTQNWGEYADGNALSMLLYPIIPASASVVYRRNALENCAWNTSSILEDYDLYLRLSALGEFALDDKMLSAWRIHSYNTSADFPLMMREWLAAIKQNAEVIGLDEDHLESVLQQIKFRCVADFIRNGQKREAWKMFWKNLGGASSFVDAGKMFARFIVPTKVFQAKRKAFTKSYIKQHGTLRY